MKKFFLSSERVCRFSTKLLALGLFSLALTTGLSAQTTLLFHENFEIPGGADSMVSSQVGGVNVWSLTNTYSQSGSRSIFCQVSPGTTTTLTTLPFSTLNHPYVTFSFGQICKIDYLDLAKIWVSIDGGINWIQLNGTNYLGNGQFPGNGGMFASTSYGALWQPGNPNAQPQNSWWKTEYFDITSIAFNQPDVRIRFTLQDAGVGGAMNNYGWLIDNLNVYGSPLLPLDMGVTGLISPISINCGITNAVVTINIKNFGTASVSNFPIGFSINNGTPVINTISQTLSMGTTLNHSFSPPFTIPPSLVDTTITIMAWTAIPGDQNHGNDTMKFVFNILHTPAAPQIAAVTIPSGNNTVLTVNSTDPVTWYDAFVGGNQLGVGNTFVTPVLNATTIYYPQATSLAGCVGQRASDTVFVTNDFASITGTVTYKNTASTPMNNTILQLFNGVIFVGQTTTNNLGQYSFNNLPAGNYHIVATTTKPWGGGNALDALFIMKNFIGLAPLNGLFLDAADVDASGAANAVDALLIMQRFTGTVQQFAAGDWLFEAAIIVVPLNTNVVHNFQALCFGDVNGSYIPQ